MKVLLSTRNGAQTLPLTLEAFAALQPPEGGFELHIADNGSTDTTADILLAWQTRLPMIRYFVAEAGKNIGLNRMLDAIAPTLQEDDLVVLTDDDALPDADWLCALETAARSTTASVIAGRIDPLWPADVPAWLHDLKAQFGVLYTITGRSSGHCRCIEAWGPNMAVRAGVFLDGTRFKEGFGPDGTPRFPMGSETELMSRLDAEGHTAVFVAEARVRHQLRQSSMTRAFIRARAFRHGLGCSLISLQEAPGGTLGLVAMAGGNIASAVVKGCLAPAGRRSLPEFRWHWSRGVLTGIVRHHMRRRGARAAPRDGEAAGDGLALRASLPGSAAPNL